MNLTVLRGTLSRPPRLTDLPSGSSVAALDVTCSRPDASDERADSVPVAVFDPPADIAELPQGADVVVVGRVRRRFFRTAGGTQSRTEVLADRVVPARRHAQVRRALDAASAQVIDAS